VSAFNARSFSRLFRLSLGSFYFVFMYEIVGLGARVTRGGGGKDEQAGASDGGALIYETPSSLHDDGIVHIAKS
jgi:hypothetical protein